MNSEQPRTNERREDHHLISPTALLVAHLRAETDIPFSQKIDEICEAGPTTEELFGSRESMSWMTTVLELRYKSLSAMLKKEMDEKGIRQVLELACGIQPRGLIASADPSITYIETDLPDMVGEKRSLVGELDATGLERPNYRIQSLNILDDQGVADMGALFGDGPVAIIHEGLLPYLSPDEKRIAAINIHHLLTQKGGVWITPDISNSGRMRKIIELFPGAAEVVEKISKVTGRDMKNNGIGTKEETLQFYKDIGFVITEYPQKSVVPDITSLQHITDDTQRAALESVIDDSMIWVLEPASTSK